jgi:hypothetical protein
LKDTRLNSTSNNNTNTINLVNTLYWDSQIFLNRSNWRSDVVQGLKDGISLIPSHLFTLFSEVITMIARDRNELNILEIETNLLKI